MWWNYLSIPELHTHTHHEAMQKIYFNKHNKFNNNGCEFGFKYRSVFPDTSVDKVTIGSADGLATIRHGAIVSTNDDSDHWRLYVLSGHIAFCNVGRFCHAQWYTIGPFKHLDIFHSNGFSVSRIFDHAQDMKINNLNICAMPSTTFVSILIVRLWTLSSPTVMSPWWP